MYLHRIHVKWHATNGLTAARRAQHAWYLRGTGQPPGRNHHVMNVLDARTATVASRAGGNEPATPHAHAGGKADGRPVRPTEAER